MLLSLTFLGVLASPFPTVRQTEPAVGDWCAGLGRDTIDNLGIFTLAVQNPTGNKTNSAGNPLVPPITRATGGLSAHTWAVSAQEKRS